MTDHFLLLQLLAYQTRRLESDQNQKTLPHQPTKNTKVSGILVVGILTVALTSSTVSLALEAFGSRS